jgi:hypothetical protein
VNGSVQCADEKRKLFVIDDDGKEHEMEIIKKILHQPAEQSNARQPRGTVIQSMPSYRADIG